MPSISTRTIKEIKEVAYRPEEIALADEEAAYWVVRDPGRNLTIFPPYRLGGGEYPKTYGHLHQPPYPETYRVLLGKAGFLYQQMQDGEIGEIIFKIIKEGESLTVPAEFTGHLMLNLGDKYLVVLDNDNPEHTGHTYEPVQEKKGFGYYIVSEAGKASPAEAEASLTEGLVAVPNPNFKNLPSLRRDG